MNRRALLLAVALSPSALLLGLAGGCDAGSPASPSALTPPPPSSGDPPDATAPDAADAGSVVPRGERLLGVGTDRRSTTYPFDLQRARDAGATLTTVEVAWDEVERTPDAGPDEDAGTTVFEPTLHIAGLVVPAVSGRAILELDVLDEGGRRTPPDLASLPFDDPALVARFVTMQDYVLDQTRELPLEAYVLGARVDVGLDREDADAGAYAAFGTFFAQAAAAARTKRPGLRVGVAVSPDALATRASLLAPSFAAADVVVARLAPVVPSDDGGLPPPSVVAGAIPRAALVAPEGKPLHLLGVAYPSSAGDDAQAAFVRAAFAAWDTHATKIPVLVLDRLDDRTAEAATAAAARIGRNDAEAIEALRTTGLRDEGTKTDKPALDTLATEARARGFGDALKGR